MAYITQNSPLGAAFGGRIATLNYNYQPNSEPSSATLTIVSENNKFIEPELLSDFTIPKLGIKMKVVEVQYNDDGNSKVMQIELQDSISFILDKNLILVRGIHSSGVEGDKTNATYEFYQTAGVRGSKHFQPVSSNVKRINQGVIIGSLRTILNYEPGENEDGSFEKITGPQSEIYINGRLIRSDNIKNREFKFNEKQYSVQNQWGYSISDLISAINILGLKINGKIGSELIFSSNYDESRNKKSAEDIEYKPFSGKGDLVKINKNKTNLSNDSLFFSEAGSVRSVLNTVLGKLGLTFYIDPYDGSINIIDNKILSTINKNIYNIYNGQINNLAATSLSVKKSCKDVSGRYMVLKSAPIEFTGPSGGGGGGSPAGSSSNGGGGGDSGTRTGLNSIVFNRVYYDKTNPVIIDNREKEFLKRVAYLYSAGIDDALINSYIFALGKKYDPKNWSNYKDKALYGGVRQDLTTDLDKTSFIPSSKSEREVPPSWQTQFELNPPARFNMDDVIGAYPNTRTIIDTKLGKVIKKNVAGANPPDNLSSYVSDLIYLAKGVYISDQIKSIKRALGFNFVKTFGLQVIGPFKSSEKIKNISELAPIQRLFDRIGGNPDISIDNLRKAANASAGLGTKGGYHYIAFDPNQNLSVGPNFNESYDISSLIQRNIYNFNYVSTNENSPEQYLVFTKNAADIVNDIENVCLKAWENTFNTNYPRLSFRYIYESIAERNSRNDKSYQGPEGQEDPKEEGGGGEQRDDIPSFMSITHKPSTAILSSKIDLDFYEGPIGEVQNLLNNSQAFSIEQDGPFYEASISYFRPPIESDLNILNGFSSISSTFNENGASTSISFSTKKYQQIDRSLVSQISSSNISGPLIDSAAAFMKNSSLNSFNNNTLNKIQRDFIARSQQLASETVEYQKRLANPSKKY